MKPLTSIELLEAPSLVLYIYQMTSRGHAIGMKTYNMALDRHPEYFKEEVAWRNIPEEVHNAYVSEWMLAFEEEYPNKVTGKGIIYWANHPEEYEKWHLEQVKMANEFKPKKEIIYNKHYSKYLDL